MEDADQPDSGSHYLHPSLLSTTTNSQQAVGSTQVKTLTTFNRDSFLVVIIVNDYCFIEMWKLKGLNKNFIIILKLVIFFICLEQLIIYFFLFAGTLNDVLYLKFCS